MKKYILFFFIFNFCLALQAEDTCLKVNWCSTDYNVVEKTEPQGVMKAAALTMKAWKGERVHAKFLIAGPVDMDALSFEVVEPREAAWLDETTTGFMRYVMTDELAKDKSGGCGYRPDHSVFDSSYVADEIVPISKIPYRAHEIKPVWLTFDVPMTAGAGTYKGKVRVKADDVVCQELTYRITVIDRTLPGPEDRKFHLDLWQNPYAVARMANVPVWSEAHWKALRPLMERLAKAGQKGMTVSITHKPWNGQTFDYYENMITEMKRTDGTWAYDFTLFDKYVECMYSCGIRPYIYCYSVIPWMLTFRYYDQSVNAMVDRKMEVSSPEFDDYWVNKLKAFARHLKEKGWFEQTIIAMDERPKESMEAALRVIKAADPAFKISLAGVYHPELDEEIFDYSIGYKEQYPEGALPRRQAEGKITTFYTCCSEAYPNTFTFSQPIEAQALGVVAAERGLDGYLRWAYNSWVEKPAEDSRFKTWAAGDTYLVYPMNHSSARFEKLIEGIQMYEKIRLLKEEHPGKMAGLLKPFELSKIHSGLIQKVMKRLNDFLNR